jgi:hypothetical protein
MACSVSFSYSLRYNAKQGCLLSCIKDFYILLLPYGLSNTCNMSTTCMNIICFKPNSTHKTTLHTNLDKSICFPFIRFYSHMINYSCYHFIFISITMQVCKTSICLFLLIYKCFIILIMVMFLLVISKIIGNPIPHINHLIQKDMKHSKHKKYISSF